MKLSTDIVNKQSLSGLESEMLIRTMFVDSAGFEGHVCCYFEAGLFPKHSSVLQIYRACFKEREATWNSAYLRNRRANREKVLKGAWNVGEPHAAYNSRKFYSRIRILSWDGEIDEKTKYKALPFFDFKTGRTDQEAAFKTYY
jgi:hypothetical protein